MEIFLIWNTNYEFANMEFSANIKIDKNKFRARERKRMTKKNDDHWSREHTGEHS